MDTKTLVNALKIAVREVIKEELTEILKEGLQSTINEMTAPKKSTETVRVKPRMVAESGKTRKSNIQFSDNKFANILNDTDVLPRDEQTVPSYAELMTEDIHMTSADAMNFGAGRKMMSNMHPGMAAPSVMQDPETGKNMEVAPEVAQAMTRDYSALMKAIDKKKNR